MLCLDHDDVNFNIQSNIYPARMLHDVMKFVKLILSFVYSAGLAHNNRVIISHNFSILYL
jgi:hypothetical protein